MRRGVSVLASVLGVVAARAAVADIYSFVDGEGTVHFTNAPGDPRYRLYLRTRGGRARAAAPPAASNLPADRFSRYDGIIREAASLYQIPEELVRAVIKVESDYDSRALSRTGAQGLMQLMPGTAQRMQVRDVWDPRDNILGGVRYLRVLANLFNGDLELTLAGYNAGENAVVRFGGVPPFEETAAYVSRVLAFYRRYREVRDPVLASASDEE